MKTLKWIYKPSGLCPVQAEGYFLGHYFYFRSRWESAWIEFAKTQEDWEADNCTRRYKLKSYPAPHAGYISEKEATWLIYKGLAKYAVGWPSTSL